MSKKNEHNEADNALFNAAMQGVKRLIHTKIPLIPPKKPTKKPHDLPNESQSNPFKLYNDLNLEEVSGEDLLEFHRGGLQHKVLRKLRRGQYNADATLDLHGMHVNEARDALSRFLLNCLQKGIRHILIIHGKGHGITKPILKNKLNQWLRQIELVIAFCSANQQDGRSGAVYVLLKGSLKFDEDK